MLVEIIKKEILANPHHLVKSMDCMFLILEIERLKRGDFTEEEFQTLCHNLPEDDECRFKQGCIDYQKKLFKS